MAVRILALVGDCYGARGGIARYNQDLFEALAEKGDAEIVILPRLGNATGLSLPQGLTQKPAIFSRLGFSLAAFGAAWRHRPFDVVFCGHLFMAPLAFVIARLLGARCWLQAHGTDVWKDRRTMARRMIERADLVSVVSRETRRILLGWVDLPPERVRVLPDTVQDVFTPGPPSPALRAALRLGDAPVLLTVGRLAAAERYKGHEAVFSVLGALREKHPGLIHLVAGDGDDRRRLEQAAADLAPAGAVRFLGYVPDWELPDLYRSADLYVMPSTEEGFGIVYLEAAACGLRVVGGRGGGTADAIPERVGVIVDPADRAALTAAILGELAKGRADPAAVEPYRRHHFAAAARALLARLLAQPRRIRSGI
ncbi:MAG: glycosyltransferase [Reyranella sp.]|nr:glycosyltransferase [Reyranella sp.]